MHIYVRKKTKTICFIVLSLSLCYFSYANLYNSHLCHFQRVQSKKNNIILTYLYVEFKFKEKIFSETMEKKSGKKLIMILAFIAT